MKKPTAPSFIGLCKRGEGSKMSSLSRRYFEVLKCVNDVNNFQNCVMIFSQLVITLVV